MSHIEIRLAETADIPALRAMQERSLRVLGQAYYTATQIERFIARFGTMEDHLVTDRTYLIAEMDGEMLGSAGWTTRMPGYARNSPDAHLYADRGRVTVRSVFVEPLVARQGIGKRLMLAVENAMGGEGFDTAELGATDSGLPFYQAIGYHCLRVLQIDLDDGITFRATVMKKRLAPANSDPTHPREMVA
ncbi:MAG TPA: GNAT family N-acetyltransferase [Dongiaceae bacterium]|nr:GNAT family N-acetyltransferase [Dongiaceae bacterium]